MSNTAGKNKVTLTDHMGRPIKPPGPHEILSATKLKGYFLQGMARVGKWDDAGNSGDPIRESLVRAQAPYIVTLLVYHSRLQLTPTMREYFVYAPLELQKAAELAFRLWQRWERPPREEFILDDMREVFPKVEDGIGVTPLTDAMFAEHWRDVRKRAHKAAGHPEDPFAFTCLDQDVRLQKVVDFQAGMRVKIR